MNNEYLSLLVEKCDVESILALIPEQNIIEQLTFEARLKKIDALLELASGKCTYPNLLEYEQRNPLRNQGVFAF